jgi:hypothetical protein
MRKKEKQQEMVFKYHYDKLSIEDKAEVREEFLLQSGLSLPSFYKKLAANSFKPLEGKLLKKLLMDVI